MTKIAGCTALSILLFGLAAYAQAVVTPNTEPSQQTLGGQDAKAASSAPGAATVAGVT